MVEKDQEHQPKLPIFESEPTDSNAKFAKRIAQAAMKHNISPWTDKKSEAAQEQSGIPEDLETNPIPPELAFLSPEEWHDAVLSRPENIRRTLRNNQERTGKQGTGAIKALTGKAFGRLNQAAQEYDKATEMDSESEEAKKAAKKLKFWKEHDKLIRDDVYINTIISGE